MSDIIPTLTPQAQLLAFAQRQIRQQGFHRKVADRWLEQREEPRRSLAVPAILQPLDAELRAWGAPLGAVTRDISPRRVTGLIVDRVLKRPSHSTYWYQGNVGNKPIQVKVHLRGEKSQAFIQKNGNPIGNAQFASITKE